ncbi:MAG: lytic transglycosylase domain-containing protein [Pseudomonadota bacterium]
MRVFFLSLLAWLALVSQASASDALKRALEARAAGNWALAVQESRAAGPVARDIIEWHRLRAREGSFEETQAFLARRPDWPGLPLLRARSEGSITAATLPGQVIAFFEPQAPRTGAGSLALVRALRQMSRPAEAEAELLRGWLTHSLSRVEEAAFLARGVGALAPHHFARADMLLWRGLTEQAERLTPLLSEGEAALVAARAGLREGRDGIDAIIEAVPAAFANDPGLAFERFLWRANRGRSEGAIEILETQDDLGRPEAWGNLRRRYARQLMRAEENHRAYRLAAGHGLSEGRHYADLEWLAGYIALRKLRDADTALAHFERFEKAVDTPISLARAQYWQARAHAAVDNESGASADYARAARHQTAFYGLLAAEAIGAPLDPALAGGEAFPPWQEAGFTQSSVYEAARLLLAAGDLSLGERFLTHLAESLGRVEIGQMAEMARALGEPHLEVMIAKRAVQYGIVLEGPYFPLHPLADIAGNVPAELALAIARRESEFDPAVSSGVGARGLMQLMPATAEEMARDMGIPFLERRLLGDPDYNARLGLTYLAELLNRYGASPVLVSVAYNAGPSRADAWIDLYGDPRSGRVDLVDWIEHIPFRETRNYVMRVTESLPIYRARLSATNAGEIGLLADLRGARPGNTRFAGPPPPDWAPVESLRPRVRPDAPATE